MGRFDAESEALGSASGGLRPLNNRTGLFAGANALSGLAAIGVGVLALGLPVVLRSATASAPTLRAALEMMMTLFALAGTWLLRTQFASSRRLSDLLLLAAALVLGLVSFAVGALPAALDLRHAGLFAAAQLSGTLFVGAMFLLAALTPSDRLVAWRRHPLAITCALSLIGLAGAALGGLLAALQGDANRLAITGNRPVLVAVVILATAALVYAAIAFLRRQRADADRVAGMIAVAMILLAGASFADLRAGSLVAGRIDTGVGLRTLAFALILAAAVLRERQVRTRISRATALAERRRVARDLHDGIAQDLAFIAAHGPRLAEGLGDDHPVVVAAKRALALSRSTISELSDPEGATVHESLEAVAQELADRFDISIAVNAQLDHDLPSHEREHLTRIAREAIANAARHGGARNVIVSLCHTETGIALRVVDDGCGIAGGDPAPTQEGFGLRSMRERATSLGGRLSVRQQSMGGTELEVVVP
jgi:signal transduction histidine kinase